MRKSKLTEEQIVCALKQAELGVPVLDVYSKYGVRTDSRGKASVRARPAIASLDA